MSPIVIEHRILMPDDAGAPAKTTITVTVSPLAEDLRVLQSAPRPRATSSQTASHVRHRKARVHSARQFKATAPRVVSRPTKKLRADSQHDARRRPNHQQNVQWPNWSDPLDFDEVPEPEAVARINAAGYFTHTATGHIYKIDEGGSISPQKPGGFNSIFARRFARCADGKLISAGGAWRRSTNRREYRHIGYWPDDHGRPDKSHNLWRGWGVEPEQGDWSIIHDHILHVIGDGSQEKTKNILDWCAHMFQRPWEKPGVALVLIGRKGTGKTLLTEILARVVGRQNTLITADGKKLFARFNSHIANKLIIGAEEAFFSGNRKLVDKLKHLLTGGEIEVEQKFGDRLSMKSMHRMIMTSNRPNVIEMTGDERRFFVCEVSAKRQGDHAYFAPLWRVANGEDDATAAAFMHELKTRDITNWNPERAARESAELHLVRQRLVDLIQSRGKPSS